MRTRYAALAAFCLFLFLLLGVPALFRSVEAPPSPDSAAAGGDRFREISGVVAEGETMAAIFHRYGLDPADLFGMRQASASVHRMRSLVPGRPYRIETDSGNNVLALTYQIDDERQLRVVRTGSGFEAKEIGIQYEIKTEFLEGTIEDSLVAALGGDPERVRLALELSDIFSWDVDFATDLRKGDSFRIAVEERWLNGRFQGYRNILAAEFVNAGAVYRAYRYEVEGKAGYYDEEGKSLRKAFLKAPLNYRRITSRFTASRMHPILKIRRPHFGVDYAAPRGTPVQAMGDGVVRFAGTKGPNGKLVILAHPGGYRTSYGHLSRIGKGIRRGARVSQGDIVGYVGSTGLATGPHLDFRIRKNGRYLNPLTVLLPRGRAVPERRMADYGRFRREMDERLAEARGTSFANKESSGESFLR